MSGPDGPTTSPDLPIVGLTNNQVTDLGVKLNPEKAAQDVKAIRDAFLRVLNQQAEAAAWSLKEVDVSLTVSTTGSIGWVPRQRRNRSRSTSSLRDPSDRAGPATIETLTSRPNAEMSVAPDTVGP